MIRKMVYVTELMASYVKQSRAAPVHVRKNKWCVLKLPPKYLQNHAVFHSDYVVRIFHSIFESQHSSRCSFYHR